MSWRKISRFFGGENIEGWIYLIGWKSIKRMAKIYLFQMSKDSLKKKIP
jgi:hypothetical protein